MKAGSASSYVARNVLPFGTKNAVTNFCAELYLFPERVTYVDSDVHEHDFLLQLCIIAPF